MRPPMRSTTELRRLLIVNFCIFINILSYFRQSVIRTAQDGESAERREIDILRQQLKEALERERVREGIEVDQQFEEQEALDMEFEIMARHKVKNKDNPGNEGKVSLQPKNRKYHPFSLRQEKNTFRC